MSVLRTWGLGFVGLMIIANPAAARLVITNTWSNVANSTKSGDSVTLNDSSASPQPRIVGSLEFSPGKTSVPYSLQTLSNLLGYCWGTATPGDGCDSASNTAYQVVVQTLAFDVEGRVTDFIIYFGYDALSCPGETATLTVNGVTYEATNPCALSADADFGGDGDPYIVAPADTGALEFLDGTLVNPQNYLGQGWTIKSSSIPTSGAIPFPAEFEDVAIGPNANGSTRGDPWILGDPFVGFGYSIYHLENGVWVNKPGQADRIAVSPQGSPWIIDSLGNVYSWNGTEFVVDSSAPCATWIGVGPNAFGLRNGDPWIISCEVNPDGGGYFIYQRQSAGWVQKRGAGVKIAVSPQGYAWIVNSLGSIYYWDDRSFAAAPASPPCASNIAVGPTVSTSDTGRAVPFRFGDVWILGCTADANNNYPVYQLQDDRTFGLSWYEMGNNQAPGTTPVTMGIQIAVSPDLGIPWIYGANGALYR
jgi:hypothetical protein